MSRIFNKIIATLMVMLLMGGNIIVVINKSIAEEGIYENQNAKTNNANVEFDVYFEGKKHETVMETEKTDNKLFVDIKIKNEGYIKNAVIDFSNGNYNINPDENNEYISKIDKENKKIEIGQIDSKTNIVIEVPITMDSKNEISTDYLNKEIPISIDGIYVNGNGKEIKIAKTVETKISWIGKNEIENTIQTNKYIPYVDGEKSGVLLQMQLNTKVKDNKFPVKSSKIEIDTPKIDGLNPTNVKVIVMRTEATNGATNGVEFNNNNYNYNSENGKLNIEIDNIPNENNIINWKKTAEDEYLITYTYEGKDTYNKIVELQQNNDNLDIESNIKVENTLYTFNEEKIEKTITYKPELKEKLGELTTIKIEADSKISKGYIYANYDIKDETKRKETTYGIRYIVNVEDLNLTENIIIKQKIDQFANDKDELELTTVGENNYTYNKEIKISRDIFQKILGEEGKIEIYDNMNNKIAEINKETEINEYNEYKIDISEKNTNEITIKSTKPQSEGELKIIVEKAVAKNINYSIEQMRNFKKINSQVEATILQEKSKTSTNIEMAETKNEATLSVNKEQLSTIAKNNHVEIRATLDTSSVYNSLYKNPSLEIELPKIIENIEVNSIKALYNDELKVTTAKLIEKDNKKYINVGLEGTQTKYSSENPDIKGTSIVIDTNMDINKLETSQDAEIKMKYINNSENSEETNVTAASVPVIAPTGLITTNEISNYKENDEDVIAMIDENKKITLDTYKPSRNIEIRGQIINNYENDISDIKVLGRFPVTGISNINNDENVVSNFDIIPTNKISVDGIDTSAVKIYYTTNGKATEDLSNNGNGWTENPNNIEQMKSYLIVINNTCKSDTIINFKYTAKLPEKLTHNKDTSTMYKVVYKNNDSLGKIAEIKNSPVINLSTGKGAVLDVKLESSVPDGTKLKNRPYARFYVKIKNTGDIEAKNVKLEIPILEDTNLVEYVEGIGTFENVQTSDTKKEITVGNLKVNDEYITEYYLKINGENNRDDLSEYVTVSADNISQKIESNKITYKFDMDTKISIMNIPNTFEYEKYGVGKEVKYDITVKNVKESQKMIAKIPLPEGVTDVKAYFKDFDQMQENGVTIEKNNIIFNLSEAPTTPARLIVTYKIGADTPEKISTIVTVEKDNEVIAYSNECWIYKGIQKLTARQLEPSKYNVKETESFTYQYELVSNGTTDVKNIIIENEMPANLNLIDYSFKTTNLKGEILNNVSSLSCQQKDNKNYFKILSLPQGVKMVITVKVSGRLKETDEKSILLINKASITAEGISKTELENREVYLEYNPKTHDNAINGNIELNHQISGIAWFDKNKNGERDSDEIGISGVEVILLYKSNGSIVKDSKTGEEKKVKTDEKGRYEFTNVVNNEYLVLFLYDSGKYSITTYQKNGVDANKNSDAVETNKTINGNVQIVGITNTITIVGNSERNIDIGLYQDEKFDLKLDKYITKISLTTPTIGTKTYEYGDSTLEKIEILGRNAGKSSMVIEYKIVVKNEGGIAGYARKIVDYLPENIGFSTDLNKDWYMSKDNKNIYNTSLTDILIQPGETKELKLVVTKKITENSIGTTLKNQAEIYESYNEQGLTDIDSKEANKKIDEDDLGQADLIISLVTGKIAMYIGLVIVILTILTISIIIIKKKVLHVKNK